MKGMKSFLVATVDREFKKIEKQKPHPPRRFVRGDEGERNENIGERVDVSDFLTQTLLANIGHRDWTTRRFFSFFSFFFMPFFPSCSFLTQQFNRDSMQKLEDLLLQHRKYVSLSLPLSFFLFSFFPAGSSQRISSFHFCPQEAFN